MQVRPAFFTVGLLLYAAFFFILFNISCVLFIDIDECNTSPCHYNASCTDNDGSFVCQCNNGFSGDGLNCTSKASFFTLGLLLCSAILFCCLLFLDIDECSNNPCHYNASCTDNEGSFHCKCNVGFSGDGQNCISKALVTYVLTYLRFRIHLLVLKYFMKI